MLKKCLISSSVLRNKQGEIIGIVSSYRDISDRKRLESKLEVCYG